ncbi:MAG: hypothetical protein WBE76_29915 [Terracidiphilus sp.]
MKSQTMNKLFGSLAAAMMLVTGTSAGAAEVAENGTVPVTMTVTANVAGNKRMPEISRDEVVVKQGKSRLEVTDWVAARGDRAGLELFILIDDAADYRISLQYDELRAFINAQPASTLVGVGYMRNSTVQIAQNLTSNHDIAAQALRLPLGYPGAHGSPYLSVVDLMKNWPVDQNRREILMLTSGIGRDGHIGWRRGYRTDVDVETASAVAQRTGTNIFSIYAPGASRFHRGYWAGVNGQMNMTRLSDSTGGAAFYLGLHSPVSIRPYLDQLQTMLDNQYLLSFSAKPGKRPGLRSINLSTEVAGVDLAAHDAVWIAGGR